MQNLLYILNFPWVAYNTKYNGKVCCREPFTVSFLVVLCECWANMMLLLQPWFTKQWPEKSTYSLKIELEFWHFHPEADGVSGRGTTYAQYHQS